MNELDENSEEREMTRRNSGRGVRLVWGLFRLQMSSDDFVFPGLFDAFNRLVLVVILPGFWVNLRKADSGPEMPGGLDDLVSAYVASAVIVCGLNMIASLFLSYHSARGIIWDPHEKTTRSWVEPALSITFILTLLEVVVLLYGTVVTSLALGQEIEANLLALGLLTIFLWLGFLCKAIVFLMSVREVTDLLFAPDSLTSPVNVPDHITSGSGRGGFLGWKNGCLYELISALCFRKTKAYQLREAAKILTQMFDRDLFMPSDIAAAFILIFQRGNVVHQSQTANNSEPDEDGQQIPRNEDFDAADDPAANADVLLHFMKYAYAVYGSSLYMISPRFHFSRFCHVIRQISCCSCCCFMPSFSRQEFVEGDGCCLFNLATVRSTLGMLDDEDIVYFSASNSALVTPFMVIIDHEKRKIVIAVRGTGSLFDVVTDVQAMPGMLNGKDGRSGLEEGFPDEFTAHTGMLEAAKRIYKLLVADEQPSLRADRNPQRQNSQNAILNKAITRCSSDYGVVVTGHSLGSGIATVLGFLLRRKYPDTLVYAYAVVGGTLSPEAQKESEKFTYSVTAGDDVITRLSLISMQRLRNDMVSALRECQEPKYKVLFQGVSQALRSCLCPCCSGREAAGNVTSSQPLLLHTSRRESESTTTQTETTLASSSGGASNSSPNECPLTAVDHTWPEMCPPGRLFHLMPPSSSLSDRWEIRRVSGNRIKEEFRDIVISPRMVTDHMPYTYIQALTQLTQNQNRAGVSGNPYSIV